MFLRVLTASISVLILQFLNYDTNAATIYVPDKYSTIQDAVDNAHSGDTVSVRDGEYHSNITKPLILMSENGPEKVLISAAMPAKPVIHVSRTERVVIRGFTATGSAAAGIYIENTVKSHVSNNRTVSNRNGIFLHASNDNTLSKNTADFNTLTGIYLESSNNNSLAGNETNSNNEKGIFLNSSNNNSITSNISNRNQWNGITLWASNNNRVEKNEVMRNTYSIIISGSTGNMVNDNYTWTNLYIILPIILIYIGIIMFFIQRKIFALIYREI